MKDEILEELQAWLCGFVNQEKSKEQDQKKLWNYIFSKGKEK